jgi:hypothetical protein
VSAVPPLPFPIRCGLDYGDSFGGQGKEVKRRKGDGENKNENKNESAESQRFTSVGREAGEPTHHGVYRDPMKPAIQYSI